MLQNSMGCNHHDLVMHHITLKHSLKRYTCWWLIVIKYQKIDCLLSLLLSLGLCNLIYTVQLTGYISYVCRWEHVVPFLLPQNCFSSGHGNGISWDSNYWYDILHDGTRLGHHGKGQSRTAFKKTLRMFQHVRLLQLVCMINWKNLIRLWKNLICYYLCYVF